MPTVTHYNISLRADRDFRCAVVADLHSSPKYEGVLESIAASAPDVILIPGDLCHCSSDITVPKKFLEAAVKIAPVLYSYGNHERYLKNDTFSLEGLFVINSGTVKMFGVTFGGLRSGFVGQHETSFSKTPRPETAFLDFFEKIAEDKILLCHHPEYYDPYLRDRNIELLVSGHAHGGQWSIFGRGVFAPGQGFFPKYTHGIHDGRLVISRGVSNSVTIPRLGNPTELVVIDIKKK